MTHKEAKEGLECKTYDESEKQKKRIYALERALKMAGHNITCWACEHIGRSDFCSKCDNSFSNWSFNQKAFEAVQIIEYLDRKMEAENYGGKSS